MTACCWLPDNPHPQCGKRLPCVYLGDVVLGAVQWIHQSRPKLSAPIPCKQCKGSTTGWVAWLLVPADPHNCAGMQPRHQHVPQRVGAMAWPVRPVRSNSPTRARTCNVLPDALFLHSSALER